MTNFSRAFQAVLLNTASIPDMIDFQYSVQAAF